MTGVLARATNSTFTPRSGGTYLCAPLLRRECRVSNSSRPPAKSTKNTIEVLLVRLVWNYREFSRKLYSGVNVNTVLETHLNCFPKGRICYLVTRQSTFSFLTTWSGPPNAVI